MLKAKNASQSQTKPQKYQAVPITLTPCSEDELETHLRGFIESFIAEAAQERWVDYLIEKRPLWFAPEAMPRNMRVRRKVDALLNSIYSVIQGKHVRFIEGVEAFPLSLSGVFGTALGIYFAPNTAPCKMTAAEAATKATEEGMDAILSFAPGKSAISFYHEGGAWLCAK